MTMSGLLSFLEERLPGKFQINAPMERYTTFRVGGPADLLVEPETRRMCAACSGKSTPSRCL